MEVDFPPTFPFAPPFFRILKPRLLPFLQRGGGHVTSGSSLNASTLYFSYIDLLIGILSRRDNVYGTLDSYWVVS